MIRRLAILAGTALVAAGIAAGPALAAPATAAAPAISNPCPSGYAPITLTNDDSLFLAVDGADAPLDLSTDADNCWTTAGFGSYGNMVNRDGYCASYDASDNTVNATSCSGDSWDEWEPISSGGGTLYCNEYGLNHGSAACNLEATSLNVNATLTLGGSVNDRDVWGS